MRFRLNLFTALAFLLPALRPVHADKVDDYISEQMSKRHVPGISVAVVNHGQIALAKGYGLSNAELGIAATRVNSFQDVIKNRANGYSYSPAGLHNCEYVSPTQPFSRTKCEKPSSPAWRNNHKRS